MAAEEQFAKEGPDNSDVSSHSHSAENGGFRRAAVAEAGMQPAALQSSRGGQSASETDSPALAVLQRRRHSLSTLNVMATTFQIRPVGFKAIFLKFD